MSRNRWMTTGELARLLGCDQRTLRKHETPDGRWCEVFGLRIRVYRYGPGQHDQRRYDRAEVERAMKAAGLL